MQKTPFQGLYTIGEHTHRFAAWTAARAASVSGCRFKVEDAQKWLQVAGLNATFSFPEEAPTAKEFDHQHLCWRVAVIGAAKGTNIKLTHGVAAKLINIYLKARFVCSREPDIKWAALLHPPIDRVLLTALASDDFAGKAKTWRRYRDAGWSRFSSRKYHALICRIRCALDGAPMWSIEQYWKGHK
jgi:hypothetical protein